MKWLLPLVLGALSCTPPPTAPIERAPVREAALASWERATLSDGSTMELLAEHPRAPFGQVGAVELRITAHGRLFTMNGPPAIFGDPAGLAARAGTHEATDVWFDEVGITTSALVVGVRLGTHTGEDLQSTLFWTSLWSVGLRGEEPKRVWAGASGERHLFFEACFFSELAYFHVDSAGVLSASCDGTTKRFRNAKNFPACAAPPAMPCAEGVVARLH